MRRASVAYEKKRRRCVLRRPPAPKVRPLAPRHSWTTSSPVVGCARARRRALAVLLTRRRAAGHAVVQVQALKQAEERWGLVFPEGEPVPVPGHDWEWQIESHGIKTPLLAVPPPASSLSAENLSRPTSPAPITHMTTETGLVSLSPAPSMMTPVCPGAPCKKRVRFAPEDPETVVSMDIIQKIKDAFNRIAEREPTKDDWLDLILEINKQINMLESPATSIQSAPQVRDEDPVTEVEAEAEAEPEVAQPHAFPDTQPAAEKSLTY